MNLIACDGTWSVGTSGEIVCTGAVHAFAYVEPFALPALTYTDANLLLSAMTGLLALVLGFAYLKRVFFT